MKNKAELTKMAKNPSILPSNPPFCPQMGQFSNFCKTYHIGTQKMQHAILYMKKKTKLPEDAK